MNDLLDQPHEIAAWTTLFLAAVAVATGTAHAVTWKVVTLAALALVCLTGSRLSAGPVSASFDDSPD